MAGFRVDVANGLYKDAELRDNPPLDSGNPLEGAFGLRFVYNTNRPETHGVYRDWRKIAESYSPERLLLGETWVPDAQRLAAYYGDNDELQLGFNFPFAFASLDPARLAAIVEQTLAALPPGGCPVWMGPTTTWAGSPAAGAAATSARSGSPCSCWPPCPAPACSTTATRSA